MKKLKDHQVDKDIFDYLMVSSLIKALTALVYAVDAYSKVESGVFKKLGAARKAYNRHMNLYPWTREITRRRK